MILRREKLNVNSQPVNIAPANIPESNVFDMVLSWLIDPTDVDDTTLIPAHLEAGSVNWEIAQFTIRVPGLL